MSEKVWKFFEQNESRIPGVKTAQIELAMKKATPPVKPREFARYAITIQNDGGVEIVPESGPGRAQAWPRAEGVLPIRVTPRRTCS